MTASEAERHPVSPCLGICLMDPRTRMCRGCLRTVEEIAAWYQADAVEKRGYWRSWRSGAPRWPRRASNETSSAFLLLLLAGAAGPAATPSRARTRAPLRAPIANAAS